MTEPPSSSSLIESDDTARQGALRFVDAEGRLLSGDHPPVPRLADIEELRRVAQQFENDPEGAEEEARELAGAAGSLGGARPKANVSEGNALWIAKFTSMKKILGRSNASK